MTDDARFTDWFKQATGHAPYPYQTRFACEPDVPFAPLDGGSGNSNRK